MSLQSDESRIQYTGNNSTVAPYAVPFRFFAPEDLRVVVTSTLGVDTLLALGTNYTVTGEGSESGGNILTLAAWNNTYKVTIYREVDATQTTVYEENAKFPSESHERALDKLTMLAQQIGRKVRQCLRFRESDGRALDGEIPELVAVPSSLVGIDADRVPRAMTAAEVAVWLNISQAFFGQGSVTFLNTADRNAAVPQFLGQVGVQLDNGAMYTGTALTAGSWGTPLAGIANGSIVTAMLANAVLSADVAGRAKMADAFITLAKIGSGIFTADTNGRLPFASGFVNSGLCAAGLFAALAPSGAVLQTQSVAYSTYLAASGAAVIPYGDAIPTSSQGTQILSKSITPSADTSKIRVRFHITAGAGAAAYFVAALFRGAITNAIYSAMSYQDNANGATAISGEFIDSPATTSATTYNVNVGGSTGTTHINGTPAGRRYGGVSICMLTLEEIKA